MPMILVIEQEQRYVERISAALSSQGWQVEGVQDRATAVQHITDQPASLVVVNSEVPESNELIKLFSRRFGGPGAVALIPENAPESSDGFGADEVLQKPFSDQDIRQAVRRCLVGASGADREVVVAPAGADTSSQGAAEDGLRLTSEDIFGDVVSELESALSAGTLDERATPEDDVPTPDAEGETSDAEAVAEAATEAAEADGESLEIDLTAAMGGPAAEPAEPAEPADDAAVEATAGPEVAPAEPPPVVDEPAAPDATARPGRVDDEVTIGAQASEAGAAVPEPEIGEAARRETTAQEPATEEPETDEAEVEVAASDGAEQVGTTAPEKPEGVPPKKAPVDPAAVLDARIREAAAEGTRLAAVQGACDGARDEDAARATDDLLRRALMGLDDPQPEAAAAAEETESEVERLVSSVVPRDEEDRDAGGEPAGTDDAGDGAAARSRAGAAAEPGPTVTAESAEEPDLGEEPGADIEGVGSAPDERQTRLRLIWAIAIVVVLILLGFLLLGSATRGAADRTPAESGTSVPSGDARAPEGSGAGAAGRAVSPAGGDELRRELETQRRELQEEIAKGRASEDERAGY